jgi:hypothetical protein
MLLILDAPRLDLGGSRYSVKPPKPSRSFKLLHNFNHSNDLSDLGIPFGIQNKA